MNSTISQLTKLVIQEIGLLLIISIGIFMFILFFQPFPVEQFDPDNQIIFIAGFAGIIFLLMVVVRASFRFMVQNGISFFDDPMLMNYLETLVLITLNSVALAFYLRYVGSVGISFNMMAKVVFISLVPPVVLTLNDRFRTLKYSIEKLKKENETKKKEIHRYEEDYLNQNLDFVSEYSNEKLTLLASEVAFIRSANNYVEIVYKETDTFKKKMLRNTLKNIEKQLKPFSNFVRNHRTCIINTFYIDKLIKELNNHWIIISGYNEKIPVSRQYLNAIKQSL